MLAALKVLPHGVNHFIILRQLKGCFPFSLSHCNIILVFSNGVNYVEIRNFLLLACLALGGNCVGYGA
jgi:hypothetical protein